MTSSFAGHSRGTGLAPSGPPRTTALSASARDTGRTGPLALLAIAALLAGGALGASALAVLQSSLEWGIASVLLAASASLRAVSASSQARRAGLVLPLSFIGLWTVAYGFASLAWRRPSGEMLAQSGVQLRPGSLPFGLAIASVGLLAWTAGYSVLHLRLVRAIIGALRQWSTRGAGEPGRVEYSVRRIVGVYAVGLSARLVMIALGRYSYVTSDLSGAVTQSSPTAAMLSHLEFLTTVGLLLLAYACFQSRTRTARRLLALALVLEIPFGLLSGMRSFLLLRLLGVMVTYMLVRRRVPTGASVAMLAVLAVITPFTNAYRGEVRDASGTTVGARGAAELIPALLGATLREISPRDVVSGPSDFVTSRLRLVDEVAVVGQRAPSEINFIPASDTMVEATTVLIPRAIWADKPVYSVGLQYARDFWNQPDSIVSSRSPAYAGDAYYRGGWVGLVMLMALLGGLMAAVSTSLSPRLYPPAIPMFIVAWTLLMNIEGTLPLLGAGLVQALLITAVAMRWASSTGRSSQGTNQRFLDHDRS